AGRRYARTARMEAADIATAIPNCSPRPPDAPRMAKIVARSGADDRLFSRLPGGRPQEATVWPTPDGRPQKRDGLAHAWRQTTKSDGRHLARPGQTTKSDGRHLARPGQPTKSD